MSHPAWLTARREPGEREIGEAFWLMGAIGLACCAALSLLTLLILGPGERPDPLPIDYVFRQRWTWVNVVAPLFLLPFPAMIGGVLLARAIAGRRQLLPLSGQVDEYMPGLVDRLGVPPVAGAIAGALLCAVVNPGPGLISTGALQSGNTAEGALEGVGALVLAGATVGWGIGLLLTSAALRRRARDGRPRPARPAEWATAMTCRRIAVVGILGAAAGALVAYALFGLADRPLELVRDPGPARFEQWDWLNEGRHVLVGATVGLFAGMIGGRLLAEPPLRAAGYEGMPFGPLGRMWRWLAGLPVLTVTAAFVTYEMQNPDRIFDEVLPVTLGLLAGLALALLAIGVRLRSGAAYPSSPNSPGGGLGAGGGAAGAGGATVAAGGGDA